MCVRRFTLQLHNFGFIIVWWSTRVSRLKIVFHMKDRFTRIALLILIHSIWYLLHCFFFFLFFCKPYYFICVSVNSSFILIILPSLFTRFIHCDMNTDTANRLWTHSQWKWAVYLFFVVFFCCCCCCCWVLNVGHEKFRTHNMCMSMN